MPKFVNILKLRGFAPSSTAVDISASTDSASASRLRIDSGGRLTWGDGTNAGDTNLYRFSGNTLKTDDSLVAGGGLTIKSYEVDTDGASTGTVLKFDGTKFSPGVASTVGNLDDLSDVNVPAPNTNDVLTYNGATWVAASVAAGGGGASVTVSDTPPSSPSVGDLWYESDTGATYVYYDSFWVEVGGAGAIVDGAINTNQLADGSVTEPKLANNAVTTNKILNDAVTTDKIVNNAVTISKLSTTLATLLNSLNTTSATVGQALVYDGTQFSPANDLRVITNNQTASYSLVLADAGKLVEMGVGSANTLTVPLNSAHAFPIGTQISILQTGAGQTTVQGTGGVTVNGTPGLKLRAQWSAATLIKRGTDTWVLVGDLAA